MATTAKKTSRTATREKRRQQLIDATMKCIARKGMGSTTLGDVAGEAGLSGDITECGTAHALAGNAFDRRVDQLLSSFFARCGATRLCCL